MTVSEMIKKYDVRLATEGRIGIYSADRAKKDNMIDTIFAAKPDIIAYLTAEEEAAEKAEAEKAAAERQAKIDAIEGLRELELVIEEHERYRDEFNAAMESEDGIFPHKPKTSIEDTKKKYPRAAAYLEAEDYYYSGHYGMSAAGRKARELIINGEDYEQVIAEMKKEWSDYCSDHMWD